MGNIIVMKVAVGEAPAVTSKLSEVADEAILDIKAQIAAGENPKYMRPTEKEAFIASYANPKIANGFIYMMGSFYLYRHIKSVSKIIEVRDIDAYGISGLSNDMKEYIRNNTTFIPF